MCLSCKHSSLNSSPGVRRLNQYPSSLTCCSSLLLFCINGRLSFVIGLVLAMITMGVVDSAVNTVVVCFAEAPEQFDVTHPEHSRVMRSAWRQVYQIAV